jgi:hypothetical protein
MDTARVRLSIAPALLTCIRHSCLTLQGKVDIRVQRVTTNLSSLLGKVQMPCAGTCPLTRHGYDLEGTWLQRELTRPLHR